VSTPRSPNIGNSNEPIPRGYNFDERALAQLGALLLQKDRNADAIAILKLNVEEYPKSAGGYDALAEAYAQAGQKPQALANYRKALELDAKDPIAADRLKELEKN
jgi:D-alanyl-D-alanine-carboxypeptidase/D-alanyl-D-alanine-endopeptidase